MKGARLVILVALLLVVVLRLVLWRRRGRRPVWIGAAVGRLAPPGGAVALIAGREIRERARSRVFRVGTALIVLVVIAAVVIPVLRQGHHNRQRIGVVGALSAPLGRSVVGAGEAVGVQVILVPEANQAQAEADVRSGHVQLAIIDGRRLVVKQAISGSATSSSALLVRSVAGIIALQGGLEAAGIPPAQAEKLAHPAAVPITSLEPAPHNQTARTTAVYGLILMFVLLSQYGAWILMGVVEEKSSRVVEVLLAAVRPAQLLAGKVLGIGSVALAQGVLLVAVALGVARAVGSDLVKGTAPVEVAAVLLWLVLGYSFYCWVYAAGGALAERQEHVQTLAFPLQLPILFGYIVSLTAIGAQTPSTFIRVLAFLPPTAPFAMTVLVALGAVAWWQVAISAAITVAATVGVARVAATVYRRAILRTGRRVRLGEVLGRSAA